MSPEPSTESPAASPVSFKWVRKDGFYYLHCAITLALMFLFPHLTPFGEMTPMGMQVLGIFLALLYGWSTADMIWPSILGIIMLGLSDYPKTAAEVFMAGFGDSTNLLVLLSFIIASIVDRAGLCQFIAQWFISRKICIGRPWVFISMLFLCAFILGAFVNIFAAMILMWTIFYSISDELGWHRRTSLPALVLIGLMFSALMGLGIWGFKGMGLIGTGTYFKLTGLQIDYLHYTILAAVCGILSVMAYLLIMRFFFRPDLSVLADKSHDRFAKYRHNKMTSYQKAIAMLLILMFSGLFLPSILPKTWGLYHFLNSIGALGTVALCIVLALFFQLGGKKVISFKEMAQGIQWETFIMLAAVMPLSTALTSADTGIMSTLSNALMPYFSKMSALGFSLFILFLLYTITQFCNNVVTLVVMLPIMCTFAEPLGANPTLLAVLMSTMVLMALLTPSGSVMGAMIFSNQEWITTKDAYKFGLMSYLIILVIFIGVGYPLGSLLF